MQVCVPGLSSILIPPYLTLCRSFQCLKTAFTAFGLDCLLNTASSVGIEKEMCIQPIARICPGDILAPYDISALLLKMAGEISGWDMIKVELPSLTGEREVLFSIVRAPLRF